MRGNVKPSQVYTATKEEIGEFLTAAGYVPLEFTRPIKGDLFVTKDARYILGCCSEGIEPHILVQRVTDCLEDVWE